VTLVGTQSTPIKFTAFGGFAECPNAVFTGHKYSATPHALIQVPTTTVTLSAEYGKCTTTDKIGNKFASTIDMNGCDYVLHIGATTGKANTYGVSTTVACAKAGEHIQLTLFNNSELHTEKICTVTFTVPGGGVTGPSISTDTINDDFSVKGTFGALSAHKSGVCGTEENQPASLNIDATFKGKSQAGSDTGITITDNFPAAGEANAFTMFGGKLECPGTVFTGHKYNVTPHAFIESSATMITLTAHYGECKLIDSNGNQFPLTVDMNSCDYVLHIAETTGEADTYGVTTTVACAKAGDHIQMTLFSSASHTLRICTLTLTPAGTLTGPHITTDTVTDDLSIKGTFGPYTIHKSGLCGAGEDKSMQFHIDSTFVGVNQAGGSTGITVTDAGA
jgi:hypothetical protein